MERTKTEPAAVGVHTCPQCGRLFTATGEPDLCVFCRSQRRRDAKSAPAEPVTVATVETETGPEPVDPPVEKIDQSDNATFGELREQFIDAWLEAAESLIYVSRAIRNSEPVSQAEIEVLTNLSRRKADRFATVACQYNKAVRARADAAAVEPGPDVKDLV